MPDVRTPNRALGALMREAGWTGEALARAVVGCGADAGLTLRCDRTSVAHWLAGRRPRPPVPALVAEAFSRRLARTVPPDETGLVAGAALPPPDGPPDPARALRDLGGAGTTRRDLLDSFVFRLGALPTRAARSPVVHPARSDTTLRVDAEQVRSIEAMTRVFGDMDTTFGGGHGRAALAGYLTGTVAPLLHASAPSRVRGALLTAAARLTYLCGFMCFDDELHGAAQRYYLTALAMASEAGDPVTRAIVLRGLSVQAHTLGHRLHAFDLAETAVAVAARRAAPVTGAFLCGQLALCAAGIGDRQHAVSHLGAAQSLLDRADNERQVVGVYHVASLAHQEAATLTLLGGRPGALRALGIALAKRPPGERRSRTLVLAELADLHLASDHLDQAAHTWHRFLDEVPYLDCARVRTAWASMRSTLRPYHRNRAVAALLQRASTTRAGALLG